MLNEIGNNNNAPGSIRFPWGAVLVSSASAKQAVHDIGTRGNKLKQQNKQVVANSTVVLDNDDNIVNKKWIKSIAPHSSKPGTDVFVDKTIFMREEFNMGLRNILCDDKSIQ